MCMQLPEMIAEGIYAKRVLCKFTIFGLVHVPIMGAQKLAKNPSS